VSFGGTIRFEKDAAMKRELPVPPDADNAEQAIEVARGWIVDNRLQCSLFPTLWRETPEVWGILLADFMSHIAQALARETDLTEDQLRHIISKRLIDEINAPSAVHEGDFIDRDPD
jgi:hypothetical protein